MYAKNYSQLSLFTIYITFSTIYGFILWENFTIDCRFAHTEMLCPLPPTPNQSNELERVCLALLGCI